MKRFAVTLLVIAAMPVIVAGALVAYAINSRDVQPIVFTEEE